MVILFFILIIIWKERNPIMSLEESIVNYNNTIATYLGTKSTKKIKRFKKKYQWFDRSIYSLFFRLYSNPEFKTKIDEIYDFDFGSWILSKKESENLPIEIEKLSKKMISQQINAITTMQHALNATDLNLIDAHMYWKAEMQLKYGIQEDKAREKQYNELMTAIELRKSHPEKWAHHVGECIGDWWD